MQQFYRLRHCSFSSGDTCRSLASQRASFRKTQLSDPVGFACSTMSLALYPAPVKRNARLLDFLATISVSSRSTRRPHLRLTVPQRRCVSRSSTMVCPCLFPRHVRPAGSLTGILPRNTLSAPLSLKSFLCRQTVLFLTWYGKKDLVIYSAANVAILVRRETITKRLYLRTSLSCTRSRI